MSSFADIFDATIGSIIQSKQTLIEVNSSTPIHDILRIFKENEITSIPIYEVVSEGSSEDTTNSSSNSNSSMFISQGKNYLGIISMVDILAFVLRIGDDDPNDSLSHQVKYVLGSTPESLSINMSIESEDAPLSAIVEKMSQGLHRCLVYSGPNSPMKLLTQTDVVQCILAHSRSFPPIQNALSVPIEAIKGSYQLVSMTEDNLLLTALDELRVHSAIAVVNEWGQIVANLSATDFHTILSNFTFFTNLTIKQYFTHRNLINAMTGKYLTEPVTVTSSDTLFHAAFLMVQYHIHRVWIVEDGFSGKGCVSFTDIIKAVYTLSGSEST